MTWVDDAIYAAGGRHIPSTWAAFADQTGITSILHLSPDAPDHFIGPIPKRFLWLGVRGEQDADASTRRLAGEFIRASLDAQERVLLHSSLGRHRTRWAFVAYHLMVGRSLKMALRMAEKTPWLAPYHTDQGTWRLFEQHLLTEREV